MVQPRPATTDAGIPVGSDEPSIQHPARRTVNGRPGAPPTQATLTGRSGHGTTTRGTGHADPGTAAPRRPMSEDIACRQRRYLIMMGFCIACFWITIILFLNHLGWLAAIPGVPTLFAPYVAVVFANAGHELDNVRGFMGYRPNLPQQRVPPLQKARATGNKVREPVDSSPASGRTSGRRRGIALQTCGKVP